MVQQTIVLANENKTTEKVTDQNKVSMSQKVEGQLKTKEQIDVASTNKTSTESKVDKVDKGTTQKAAVLTLTQARDLVKVTVEKLANAGMSFVENTKVLQNLKTSLPTVHSELNLQVQQEQRQINAQNASKIQQLKPQTINKWFDGQVVKATVVSNSEPVPGKPELQQVKVAINREQVTLTYPTNAKLDLKVGQQLALVVEKVETGDKTANKLDSIKQAVQELSQVSKSLQQNINLTTSEKMTKESIPNQKTADVKPDLKSEFKSEVKTEVKEVSNNQQIRLILKISPEQSQLLSQAEAKLANVPPLPAVDIPRNPP